MADPGQGSRPPDPRTLLVLGLARTGRAVARVAAAEGWTVLASDDAPTAAAGLPPPVRLLGPGEAELAAAAADLVVPSPGVPASHPALVAARRHGVRVQPEIEFAAERIRGRLVAVTGTNGKSTTVSLVGAMLAAAGRRVFTGGNLGNPLSEAAGRDDDVVVAEVSSFQLEHATTFHPAVAALLNFSADHLDRHGSLEAYLDAKLRLLACMEPGDTAVLPAGADWADRAAASTRARVVRFDATGAAGRREVRGGDLVVPLPADGWPHLPHDLENACAAVAMAAALGVGAAAAARAIAGFRPLPHRMARVAEAGGVDFWNDSKATNVGAARSSLRAFDGRVVLLLGGVAKGCDFRELAAEARRITLVVAYGEAAPRIEEALGAEVPVVREAGMLAALDRAAHEARPGDHVLLAPACASFDEFRDYADRGSSFEGRVLELAAAAGGPVRTAEPVVRVEEAGKVEQVEKVEKEDAGG